MSDYMIWQQIWESCSSYRWELDYYMTIIDQAFYFDTLTRSFSIRKKIARHEMNYITWVSTSFYSFMLFIAKENHTNNNNYWNNLGFHENITTITDPRDTFSTNVNISTTSA